MDRKVSLEDISIRSELKPGDIGYIIYMHGKIYSKEYNYGIPFETYVAKGLAEFYCNYDASMDKVWICEHKAKIIGFMLLMHRSEEIAQLRYFLLDPQYRGIGLGKKLMKLYMDFLMESNYKYSYLWTTHELNAAASLYTRHGFNLTEEKRSRAFGKSLREQKYELVIEG